jgi:hypothetical protein
VSSPYPLTLWPLTSDPLPFNLLWIYCV